MTVTPREPIVLYGFGPAFGLPDSSPLVTKVEILLKAAGLPYRIDTSKRPSAGPKKKFPFIDDNGVKTGDSTLIRFYLESAYGADFDKGRDPARIAAAYLAEKYLEHDFYFSVLENRWLHEENFNARMRPIFNGVPFFIRPLIIRSLRKYFRNVLFLQGTGRHTEAEKTALAERGFAALAAMLGDAPFFGGDAPCGSDASIAPFIAGTLCTAFDSPYIAVARRHDNLVAYYKRVFAHYGIEAAPER